MALTQISTQGIKDGTITGSDLATNVDLVDNQKLRLGTSNDLQIFHQGGGDSFVDSNSGQLYVRSNNNIYIQPADNKNGIVAIANGAVELYHDNSKKFYTTLTGAYIENRLDIGGANLGWSYPKPLNVQGSSGAILALRNWDTTTYAADTMTSIDFNLRTGNTGNQNGSCEIRAFKENGTNGNNARGLSFYTGANGGSPTERMRIDSSGNVGIGTNDPLDNSILHVKSSAAADYRPLVVEGSATSGSGIAVLNSGTQRIFIGSGGGNNLSGSSTTDGLIRAENNTVFAVGNSEKMRIDSSGNVGIGTTSPSRKLEINSGIFDVVAKFVSSDSAATINLVDGLNADGVSIGSINGNMTFRSGLSTERMRIDSSGRLIVGATSGAGKFIVQDSSLPKIQANFNGAAHFESGVGGSGGGFAVTSGHFLTFNHQPYANRGTDTNLTERMRIDSSGRVLIGTTSGSDALVVDGGSDAGTILTNSTNGNGNMMTFQCSGTSKFFIGSAGSFITGNSGTTNQGIRAEGHLLFATGGASQTMRLGDNGALGVGGNANRVIHAVQNSSHGTVGVGAFENGDSGNNHAVMFFSTVRDGNGGESFLQCNRDQDNNGQGVSAVAFIRTNGDFDSATNSYGGTSDISLKENIVDAKSQWDDIKNIKVRNFNFKDNPNQKMLGVVAQEIETVCSGLVKETSDEGTTIKTVKYSILYMKAIKGLQEAMARIEVLETEVAALKAS